MPHFPKPVEGSWTQQVPSLGTVRSVESPQ